MNENSMTKHGLFLAAIIIAVSLLISGCTAMQLSESREDNSDRFSEESYSTEMIFEEISSSLAEFNNTTGFDTKIEQDSVDKAVQMVQHFYPEYFWLDGYVTTTDKFSTEVSFMTLNDYTEDELRTMHGKLISAAENVVSKIPAGSSNYEKALFVHDYIVNNTSYASDKREADHNGLWGNAYGCLVEGSAVCQGYAEAYSLIMQMLGIECGMCTGKSDRGSHAWNYVKIDGDYYWVDTTWDDPDMETGTDDKLRHDYFMINDELMLRTRRINDNQYFIPICDSMDKNFFVMNNAYLRGYLPEEVGRILADNADTGVAEMMFEDEESFNKAIHGLFDEQEIWELSGYTGLGSTLTYSCDNEMYVLQITY